MKKRPVVYLKNGKATEIVFCCRRDDNTLEFYTEDGHYIYNGHSNRFFKVVMFWDEYGYPAPQFLDDEELERIDIYE